MGLYMGNLTIFILFTYNINECPITGMGVLVFLRLNQFDLNCKVTRSQVTQN